MPCKSVVSFYWENKLSQNTSPATFIYISYICAGSHGHRYTNYCQREKITRTAQGGEHLTLGPYKALEIIRSGPVKAFGVS